jgi:S-formylglutathione hydrolase FrmB
MKQSRTSGRVVRLAVTGLAVAAVAGITITGAAIAGTGKPAGGGAEPQVAGQGGFLPSQVDQAAAVPQAAVPRAVAKGKYAFQNKPQAVGTLAANGSVGVGKGVTFQTRGTQWALVSQLPGEEPFEPFGWRATIGNDNIGDGTSPGIQSMGSGSAVLANSVFNNKNAATVVYTSGKKAWYAKVYRLGGIPGWVESSAVLTGAKTVRQTPGPKGDEVAVFVYDAGGKLLKRFPDNAENPLPK